MTRQPWTIRRDAPLSQAIELMHAHEIRHLPVLDGGKLVGVVTERDIYKLERFKHLGNHFVVEDAMSDDVYTASSEQPVDQTVDAMAGDKLGSVVVMDRDGKVEGIFTTMDGMRVLADVLRRVAS